MNEGCDIYYARFGDYYRRGEIIMCDKIEELERKIEDLEKKVSKMPNTYISSKKSKFLADAAFDFFRSISLS